MMFQKIVEIYKNLLFYGFSIYFILLVVIGGEFKMSIKWENIINLWKAIKNFFLNKNK